MGVSFNEMVEISGERPGKDAAYLLDSTHARNSLQWSDSTSLEDGIEDTIAWANNYFEILKNMPLEYAHKP
jgi:dTDP-glucose 4,6-dehydratase